MTDRQTDRREKPLCPGKPAALPRNAGGASWVSPLSLLLINLDSEAFYGALEDNFITYPVDHNTLQIRSLQHYPLPTYKVKLPKPWHSTTSVI